MREGVIASNHEAKPKWERSNLRGCFVATLLAMTIGYLVVLLCGCATLGWKTARERRLETEMEMVKARLAEAQETNQYLRNRISTSEAQVARLERQKAQKIQR